VSKEETKLPANFKWVNLDINDPIQAQELYEFLWDNYVEDKDASFRFDYQIDFLKWALSVPDFIPEWILAVRGNNNKLYGFITGVPVTLRIWKEVVKMAEINYLCVHKSIRSKRLAPMLIKEVTWRINLRGMF